MVHFHLGDFNNNEDKVFTFGDQGTVTLSSTAREGAILKNGFTIARQVFTSADRVTINMT